MMRIRFKLLMKYRDLVGQPEVEVEVPEGSTVREALIALEEKYPQLKGVHQDEGLVLLKGGKGVSLDDVLEGKEEISLLHSIGGG